MSGSIRTDTADRVRTLTIDRPEARNALTSAMRAELMTLAAEADRDSEVDVIVITGVDPAFCAGLDLKELRARRERAGGAARPRPATNPGTALRSVGKPLICAVNGACVTGGLEIALSCHFIVASERATFADLHARFGLIPGWGLSALLPLVIGERRAREMSITGSFIDAQEALRLGLVNHVLPHDELIPFARSLAAQIIGGNQRANRAMLELYATGEGASLEQRLTLEDQTVKGWTVDPAELDLRRAKK